jgi:hypothetical protein
MASIEDQMDRIRMDVTLDEFPDEFRTMLEEDLRYVQAFSVRYGVALKDFSISDETYPERVELMYFFGETMEGYTIDGIKSSLNEDL